MNNSVKNDIYVALQHTQIPLLLCQESEKVNTQWLIMIDCFLVHIVHPLTFYEMSISGYPS